MNFIDRLLGRKEKASKEIVSYTALQSLFRLYGGSPVVWYGDSTDDYLREGYEGNYAVFTIADWCARKISTIPPILYTTKDKGAAKAYKQLRKEGSIANYLEAQRIKNRAFNEVEDTEHPLLKLLEKPNPTMYWDEFVYGYYIFKKFVGNAKIYKEATTLGLNAGKAQSLWLLPSNYIKPIGGKELDIVKEYQDIRNPAIKFLTEDMIVIRNFSADYRTPGAHLEGMSIMKAASKLLKKSNESMAASTEALQNRGASKIVFPKFTESQMNAGGLTLPDDVQIDALNAATRKRLKEAGSQGIVIHSIPLDKIEIGMSPVDLNTLENDKADIQFWCSLFHVDSRVVFNDHQSSTKDNMQGARLNSITDGIFPECEAIRNAFNDTIVEPFGKDLFLDMDYTTLPEIQRELRETAKEMSASGLFTVNEMRAVWKYDDYEGMNGDKILVPTNKQILDDMDSALPNVQGVGDYQDTAN